MSQYSSLSGFLKFLASVPGDFSNITAPPHFLAPTSVTEVANCWTERPTLLTAPALEADPEKRSLLVLKWVLASLRSQFYLSGSTDTSIKKPLNAFLGEIFTATWKEGSSSANILTEQVSHHPPITAICLWNEEHGIRAEGYCRVEMTFNGHVNVRQVGRSVLHLDGYDEDYLIPPFNAHVKGFLSGRLYPEIKGIYNIVSSSGFVSEIEFSGAGLFGGGDSNSFHAKMYHRDDAKKKVLYEVSGRWSDKFTIRDARTSTVLEEYDTNAGYHTLSVPILKAIGEQDPWESRRAWQHVTEALRVSDLAKAVDEKTKIEKAQRAMRAEEVRSNTAWIPLFFSARDGPDSVFTRLSLATTGWSLQSDRTKGVWRADWEKIKRLERPFHKGITPTSSVV